MFFNIITATVLVFISWLLYFNFRGEKGNSMSKDKEFYIEKQTFDVQDQERLININYISNVCSKFAIDFKTGTKNLIKQKSPDGTQTFWSGADFLAFKIDHSKEYTVDVYTRINGESREFKVTNKTIFSQMRKMTI